MKVINLNKARKARAGVARRAKAAENAVKFGRTKAERLAAEAREARAAAQIEAHRIDPRIDLGIDPGIDAGASDKPRQDDRGSDG